MLFRHLPLVLFALAAVLPLRAQTYVDVIDPTGAPSLWGLEYRDGFLYATDTSDDRVIRIDPETGAVTTEFSVGFDPRGIAWDGTNWRVSTGFDSSDPRIYTYAPDGTVLGSIPAPGALTHGLTLHDGLLFAAQAYPDPDAAFRGLDPADGSLEETVAFPHTQPGGIAFTALNTLWATNVGDDGSNVYELYEIDRATGNVLRTLGMPEDVSRPRGLTYDGTRYLYAVMRQDVTPFNYRIYVIDLQSSGNPAVELSAPALDFGPRVFGSGYDLPLTLFNTGDGPLEISNVTITGPDADLFATSLTPTTIGAGDDLAVTVTFSPAAFGPRQATLQFGTNDVQNPTVTVPLSGIGIYAQQHVAFVADSHDFGPVRIEGPDGFSSVRWDLEIVNRGAAPLTVTGITLDDDAFSVLGDPFPLVLAILDTAAVEIEFRPTEVRPYSATATVASNDPNDPSATVALSGEGVNPALAPGAPIWTLAAPDNPHTSFDDAKVFAARVVGDVTGDGIPDLAFAARNYYTFVVDANGWGTPTVLWTFNSCPNNNNCGAVGGNAQLFEYGMEAGADFNGDGLGDVVIGTEGGNDHVYVLDGKTGAVIWEVGSDDDPYLASYNSVSARLDVNGDGIPEVATGTGSTSDPSPNPYNHRRVYLLDGADGSEHWQMATSLPNFRTLLYRAGGEARVASGGGEDPQQFLRAFRATDGAVRWTVDPGFSPFIIEPYPDDAEEDLLVAGLGSLLVRYDGADGSPVWTIGSLGSSVWDVAVFEAGGGLRVAVGSTRSEVLAFDGESGDDAWQYDMGSQVFDVTAVPDADGDGHEDVAATSQNGRVVLLSGLSGALIWSYDLGGERGEVVLAVPDLEGNGVPEVAVGTYDLDANDGRALLLYGGGAPVPTDAEAGEAPEAFALDPAYPNPFNPATTLRYRLPEAATVTLDAFDVLGRKVWTHTAEQQPPGTYTVRFDGRGLASGLYVVRMEAGAFVQTRNVVLVK